jgi:hypothetical protein
MLLFTQPSPLKDVKLSGVFFEKVFDPKVKQCSQVFLFVVLNIFKPKLTALMCLKVVQSNYYLLLLFSPWSNFGRNKSPVRRAVWLWYAAS